MPSINATLKDNLGAGTIFKENNINLQEAFLTHFLIGLLEKSRERQTIIGTQAAK